MAHLTAQCSLCLEQTPLDRPFGYFLFYKQVVVLHFHSGAASRENMMERLSIPAGKFTKRASTLKDKKRARKSDLQASAKEKKRQQAERLTQTRWEEAPRETEGVTYEVGALLTELWTFCNKKRVFVAILKYHFLTLKLNFSERELYIFEKRYLKMYLSNYSEIFRFVSSRWVELNEHGDSAYVNLKSSYCNPCNLKHIGDF